MRAEKRSGSDLSKALTLDMNKRTESEDEGSVEPDPSILLLCYTLFKLLVLVFLLGALVAILCLGIYFLVIDKGKGGDCADTTGKDIWTYFLVKIIIGVFTQCFTTFIAPRADFDAEFKERESKDSGPKPEYNSGHIVSSVLFTLLLHIGMLGYGGIVLIHEVVCDSYTNTGLYQMAYGLFFLDCSFLFIVICWGFMKWLCRCKDKDKSESLTSKDLVVNPNQI